MDAGKLISASVSITKLCRNGSYDLYVVAERLRNRHTRRPDPLEIWLHHSFIEQMASGSGLCSAHITFFEHRPDPEAIFSYTECRGHISGRPRAGYNEHIVYKCASSARPPREL